MFCPLLSITCAKFKPLLIYHGSWHWNLTPLPRCSFHFMSSFNRLISLDFCFRCDLLRIIATYMTNQRATTTTTTATAVFTHHCCYHYYYNYYYFINQRYNYCYYNYYLLRCYCEKLVTGSTFACRCSR